MCKDKFGDEGVISIMRKVCKHVDTEKVMKAGLEFYISVNRVILCPGDKNGYIKLEFFKKIGQV